jgi:hypothetical protein
MKFMRERTTRANLDFTTLIWTRGKAFPITRLERRLNLPRLQVARRVRVIFDLPRNARLAKRVGHPR